MKNYYQILGVSQKADKAEIQKAYRALLLKHHPDANQGNPESVEKTKEINKAYQTLKDAKKRAEYDLTLGGNTAPRPSSGNGGAGPRRTATSTGQRPNAAPPAGTGNPLTDILSEIRGAAVRNATAAARSTTAGQSVPTYNISLTAREAADGVTKTINVNGKPVRLNIKIDSGS